MAVWLFVYLLVLFFGPIVQVKAGEKVLVIMCLLSTVCVLFKGVTV